MDLDEKCALVSKRETAVRNVSKELVKANEIIRKFMDQNKAEHQKAKQAARIAEEQERILTDKDKELDGVREELRKAAEDSTGARRGAEEAEAKLRRSEEDRSALENKLRTSETVIDWLNRQLTHAQRRDPGLRLAAPPEGIATFSSTMGGAGATSTPLERRAEASGRSADLPEESIRLRDKEKYAKLFFLLFV